MKVGDLVIHKKDFQQRGFVYYGVVLRIGYEACNSRVKPRQYELQWNGEDYIPVLVRWMLDPVWCPNNSLSNSSQQHYLCELEVISEGTEKIE